MRISRNGSVARGRSSALRRLPLTAAIYLAFGSVAFAQQADAAARRRPGRRPTRRRWTRSPSPRRSARKTCRRCRSASRPSARSNWTSSTSPASRITPSSCPASPSAPRAAACSPGPVRAGVHARRGQQQRGQPFQFTAQRRHVPRRAADHHDLRLARHPHVRHRPRRGARRTAGHAVRRQFAGRHDPHHHQQARSVGVRFRLQRRGATRSTVAASAMSSRASPTFRSTNAPRSASSAGTSMTPATSTTSWARAPSRTFGHHHRQRRPRRRRLQRRRTPSARARRCGSTSTRTGPSRRS